MTAAPPPGTIGFAIRDTHGRGCAFEVDQLAGEALVFGADSALRLSGEGVLSAHFVVLPHAGKLVAASASAEQPAVLNGTPLPTTWTVLEVPSRIRAGTAAVDFFHVRESAMILVDLDVETTVAMPGGLPERLSNGANAITRPETPVPHLDGVSPVTPRLGTPVPRGLRRAAAPLPPDGIIPLRRTPLPPSPSPSPSPLRPGNPRANMITTLDAPVPGSPPPARAALVLARARDRAKSAIDASTAAWKAAPRSTRILLGVVAVLVVFVLARPTRDPAPAPAAAAAIPTADAPLAARSFAPVTE
jgi:hypothetical protein